MIKIAKYTETNPEEVVYTDHLDPTKYYLVFDKETAHIYQPYQVHDYVELRRLCCTSEDSGGGAYSMSVRTLLNHEQFVLYCMDTVGDYADLINLLIKGPFVTTTDGTYRVELKQNNFKTCHTYTNEIQPPTEEDCRKKCADNVREPSEIEKEFCRILVIKERSITYEEAFNILCYVINSNVEISNMLLSKDDVLEAVIKFVTKDEDIWKNIHYYFCYGWGESNLFNKFKRKLGFTEIEKKFFKVYGIEPVVLDDDNLYKFLYEINTRLPLIEKLILVGPISLQKEDLLKRMIMLGETDKELVSDIREYFERL